MGFKRSALLLTWDPGTEFEGLEVRMRRMSVGQVTEIEALSELRKSGDEGAVKAVLTEMLDAIGEGLISWNLEEEVEQEDGTTVDVPVPATREALNDRDIDLVLAVLKAWTAAAAAVPLASKPSSPTGEPAPPPDEWASWMGASQESLPAPA